AERHVPGASVGPTLRAMIGEQFTRIRDGDRMWYRRTMSDLLVWQIEHTSLSDIIRRNTEITNLQENAFFFRAGISGTVFVDLNHDGQPSRGEPGRANAIVQLVAEADASVIDTETTGLVGNYRFDVLDGLRTGAYHVQVVTAGGQIVATSRTVTISRG